MLSGYKTAIVSLVITVLGALETFDFTSLVNEDTAGLIITGIGIVMFALRAITNTSLFKPTQEE
jgi:hypothetical protein